MSDAQLNDYVIRFSVPDVSLAGTRSGPLDYVTPVMGTLQHGPTEGELACVAKFSFQHLRIDWARQDGLPLARLFAITPEWQALYPLLFDAASERLSALNDAGGSRDILFVDEVSVLPGHRGRRLAGSLVERLASMCFRHWAAMVVRAAPEPVEGGEWSDLVYGAPFSATGEEAKKKLRLYWASFGFRPLGNTDFMVRSATTHEAAPASSRVL